ncbi:uncharacterized protein PpBr36_10789 [Pyricularia pennisetigena]|uniref:uncharacterized protein n=1 Tax=Pyricularia pennisetigena TaxID=1578925 RepID=UPI0011506CB4|nr:uncharacterized protein PpBr36_10789 [Pyricularia pennisetigena]TLS20995.1 hypothetical protein PpBr36_10789 [Pyricularia pennisetigena]
MSSTTTATPDSEFRVEVFATREEALQFIDSYYMKCNKHWYDVRERVELYKRSNKLFKEERGFYVVTTTITGCQVQVPIEHIRDGPFWGLVAPELCRRGRFARDLKDLSEDDIKELLKVRTKFRPSLNYRTIHQMIGAVQARPEGPIRKDDAVFSTVASVRWGWDPPIKYTGTLTAKQVSEKLASTLEGWEGSEQGRGLNRQLQAIKDERAGSDIPMRIRNVICIALGTMTEEAAMLQHCLALGLARQLGAREIYMQDPAYTAADKRALHQHGVRITTDDRIFNHIYSDSVVVCIAPGFPAFELMHDKVSSYGEWPAVLIWERLQETNRHLDRVTPRAQYLIAKYDVLELDCPLDRSAFLDTTVYVRERNQLFSGMTSD